MELAEITAALEGNAELLTGVTNHILDSDKGKEVIETRATVLFDQKINDHVSGIHDQYDQDMLSILGESPKANDDGTKQKTYDKIKELYTELKDLREQKGALSTDAEVKRLQKEIERLQNGGANEHWKNTFETESEKWKQEKNSLMQRVTAAENNTLNFQKQGDINTGLRNLKFNDKIPQAAREALVNSVVAGLTKNSKIEDGKVIYLKEDGTPIFNNEYKPESAENILKAALKDVLVDENTDAGGGASPTVKGSIQTSKDAQGNDVQQLQLTEGSFTTKTEFITIAEEALLKSGISRGHKDWDKLKNEAYIRYNVKDLPR